MPSKSKRLTEAEIIAFEAKRDIGEEILQSIRELKAGKGQVRSRCYGGPTIKRRRGAMNIGRRSGPSGNTRRA